MKLSNFIEDTQCNNTRIKIHDFLIFDIYNRLYNTKNYYFKTLQKKHLCLIPSAEVERILRPVNLKKKLSLYNESTLQNKSVNKSDKKLLRNKLIQCMINTTEKKINNTGFVSQNEKIGDEKMKFRTSNYPLF